MRIDRGCTSISEVSAANCGRKTDKRESPAPATAVSSTELPGNAAGGARQRKPGGRYARVERQHQGPAAGSVARHQENRSRPGAVSRVVKGRDGRPLARNRAPRARGAGRAARRTTSSPTPVRTAPVDPRDLVVLAPGVVVAALAPPPLVAGEQHGRAAAEEQEGEEVRRLATAQRQHRRVGRRALDAMIRRQVGGRSIPVLFAVLQIPLGLEGDQVGQREAVVAGDEVDRRGRACAAAGRDPGCRRGATRASAAATDVAANEAPHIVAEGAVPLPPRFRESRPAG